MKKILCLLLLLSSAMLAATGATNERINAVVFEGERPVSIFTGRPTVETNVFMFHGIPTRLTQFVYLTNGAMFLLAPTHDSTNCPLVKTSYRMAQIYGSRSYCTNFMQTYFGGGERVWEVIYKW